MSCQLKTIFSISVSIVFCFLFRYEPSEPINVTVLESSPMILNFTLSGKEVHEQGKNDISYPQIIPVFNNRLSEFYKLILDDYNDQDY